MVMCVPSPHKPHRRPLILFWVLGTLLVILGATACAQQAKIDVLRIGTSGTLAAEEEGAKEEGALESLRSFIQTETGLDNEIIRQKDWRELADKLAGKQLHLGVFQGYE